MSARVVQWVLAHAPYEGNEYTALLLLAIHAADDGTGDMPKLDLFAEQCRVARATIYRLLDRLEADGAITVEHRRGRGVTNRFAVVTEPYTSHPGDTYQNTSHRPLTYQSKTSHPGETLSETFLPASTRTSAPARAAQDSVDPVDSVVLGESTTTTRGSGPARPNGVITPAQNAKVTAFLGEVSDRGMPTVLGGTDKTAIIESDADAPTCAAAYAALVAHEWGDDWLWRNASVANAVRQINKFLTRRYSPPPPDANAQEYLDRRIREVASELTDAEATRLLGGS
jgi:hypothetical protein